MRTALHNMQEEAGEEAIVNAAPSGLADKGDDGPPRRGRRE